MDRAAPHPARRHILIGLGSAAVAALVAVPLLRPKLGDRTRRILAGNPVTRRFVSLGDAEQAEWAAQIGSTFIAEGNYRLRLAGTQPLLSEGQRPSGVTRERAFLAVFEVLDGMTMAGDLIYSMRHPQYGATPVFLNASGDARRMLAVFN